MRSGKIRDTVFSISNIDFLQLMPEAESDPQKASDLFYERIKRAQDPHQPIKSLKLRNNQTWTTLEIE